LPSPPGIRDAARHFATDSGAVSDLAVPHVICMKLHGCRNDMFITAYEEGSQGRWGKGSAYGGDSCISADRVFIVHGGRFERASDELTTLARRVVKRAFALSDSYPVSRAQMRQGRS
jgi:hypothetical protein